MSVNGLATGYCLYCLLPIAYCLLPIGWRRHWVEDFLLQPICQTPTTWPIIVDTGTTGAGAASHGNASRPLLSGPCYPTIVPSLSSPDYLRGLSVADADDTKGVAAAFGWGISPVGRWWGVLAYCASHPARKYRASLSLLGNFAIKSTDVDRC